VPPPSEAGSLSSLSFYKGESFIEPQQEDELCALLKPDDEFQMDGPLVLSKSDLDELKQIEEEEQNLRTNTQLQLLCD
jgi:hypothetical protein